MPLLQSQVSLSQFLFTFNYSLVSSQQIQKIILFKVSYYIIYILYYAHFKTLYGQDFFCNSNAVYLEAVIIYLCNSSIRNSWSLHFSHKIQFAHPVWL